MDVEIKIEGLDDVLSQLNTLEQKTKKEYARKALRKGARVILNAARRNIKSKTGNLARSLSIVTGKGNNVFITPRARKSKKGDVDGYYAHLVELGTSPHIIKKKGKGVLAIGGKIFGKKVQHPGAKAKPFLRPALDQHGEEAVLVTRNELLRLIENDR